jgi:hypothetical protein
MRSEALANRDKRRILSAPTRNRSEVSGNLARLRRGERPSVVLSAKWLGPNLDETAALAGGRDAPQAVSERRIDAITLDFMPMRALRSPNSGRAAASGIGNPVFGPPV